MLSVEGWMWDVRCEMMDVKCWMWKVGFGMGHAPREYFSHGCHRSTQKPCRVLLSKNTDCTDAHGWVFSRIVYSCSAAYRLVFDAPSAQRIDAEFFASGKLCGRMSHDGLAWYAKNLEIREICGRQLSAQCANEQAGCFILPRISQISTDAMRTACQ